MPQSSYRLIEEIADTERPDLLAVIRSLPLQKSTPLMMQYYLCATTQEIADFFKITKQAVDRKNKLSLNIIKRMMHK